jgi:hypothetical protein
MTVCLDEIEAIVAAVFSVLRDGGVETLDIDDGYYWNIPAEELQNFPGPPRDLDIGDLSEDWEFLSAHARQPDFAGGAPLRWLASVLRSAGDSLDHVGRQPETLR